MYRIHCVKTHYEHSDAMNKKQYKKQIKKICFFISLLFLLRLLCLLFFCLKFKRFTQSFASNFHSSVVVFIFLDRVFIRLQNVVLHDFGYVCQRPIAIQQRLQGSHFTHSQNMTEPARPALTDGKVQGQTSTSQHFLICDFLSPCISKDAMEASQIKGVDFLVLHARNVHVSLAV